MIRRLATAGAAIGLVATIAACGPAASISGTVVDKEFDKGGCKKTTTIIMSGKTPVPVTKKKCTADEYEIDVRQDNGETVEVDVSRSTYDRIRIGDRYDGRR